MNPVNSTTLKIRDAHPNELDEVSGVIKNAYQQYRKVMPAAEWKMYLHNIMDVRSRLAEAQLIVAEVDGRVAGTATLYIDGGHAQEAGWPQGWAGVRILAVHTAYRGRGIGRKLMDECVRRCRERGISTIGLHTTEAMDIARRMYERMGFVRVPEFDFHPAPGIVVMAYRLDLK